MAIQNTYKSIFNRLTKIFKDAEVKSELNIEDTSSLRAFAENGFPLQVIARWIQRLNLPNFVLKSDEVFEEYVYNNVLPKMRDEYFSRISYSDTPEGLSFWQKVYEDRDLYFNLYPLLNSNTPTDRLNNAASDVLTTAYQNALDDEKGQKYLDVITDKRKFKNMLVNQVLQGNQMDLGIFIRKMSTNNQEGGFDWDKSPQGSAFWSKLTLDDNTKFPIEEGIINYQEDQIYRAPPQVSNEVLNKSEQDDAKNIREIEEGENRVEYFRDTKQDSLKEFAKDFPEAEAPLNKLLDLLSIKEEGRLKKLPKKKKKKKVEKDKPVEKKTTVDTTTNIQILDLPYSYKGKTNFKAPLSDEKREDGIIYEDISQVKYFINQRGKSEYKVKDNEWYGFDFKEGAPQNRKDYEQQVLGDFMQIVEDKIVNQEYDYVFKTRIIYKDGTEEELTYDANEFKLLDSDSVKFGNSSINKTIEVGKRNITRETELKERLVNDVRESSKYLLSIPHSIDLQDQLPAMYGGNEYTGAINTKEQLIDNITLLQNDINEITDFLDSESKKEQEVESEVELTAKDITELIEGLELAFEYLDGEDLQDALDQIEGLKITLDYI